MGEPPSKQGITLHRRRIFYKKVKVFDIILRWEPLLLSKTFKILSSIFDLQNLSIKKNLKNKDDKS